MPNTMQTTLDTLPRRGPAGVPVNPRFLNARGKPIHTHRALLHFDFRPARLLSMLLLPLAFTALTLAAWPLIAQLWSAVISFWASALGAQLTLGQQSSAIPLIGGIPFPSVDAALPNSTQWWSGLVICAALLLGPMLMPARMLPLSYGLRFVGALQLVVQLYFLWWGDAFPHRAGSSLAAMMQSSLVLMLVIPWLYGFVYNIFEFSLSRKIALAGMAVGYLILLAPTQFTLAAVLLAEFSLLWHPLIYLLGTTLLQFFMLLSLYAWAMSWERQRRES